MNDSTQKIDDSKKAAAKVSPEREELQKTVKQQILMSIGLEFEEKGKLIQKLPELSDDKLHQLKVVFEEEDKKKKEILNDLFTKKPELYDEFEKISRNRVNSIYHNVEVGELDREEQKMEELLATNY